MSSLWLDDYLERIAYNGTLAANEDTLRGLHEAHVFHVPFENLDIHLGRPISLELDALVEKVVHKRRGGYCYEMNGLFAAALEALGFKVTRLIGRIMFGVTEIRPRSHQVSLVEVDGRRWLCDVSYGSRGLLAPMPLETGLVERQYHDTFRLIEDDFYGYILQAELSDGWNSLVGFTLELQHPVDYRLPNYWNSTSPDSNFVRNRIVAMPTPEGRLTLTNMELKARRNGELWTQIAADEGAYRAMLRDYFGLVLDGELNPLPGAVIER